MRVKNILILTKNVLAESDLQQQLLILGYDVFCSTGALNQIPTKSNEKNLFEYFDYVILGKTLSNLEVRKIVKRLKEYVPYLSVFRILNDSQEYSAEECRSIDDIYYIPGNHSLEVLRESLGTIFLEKSENHNDEVTFTNREKELLAILKKNVGRTIPRKKLGKQLWYKNFDNSNLEQLSFLVSSVNFKLQERNSIYEIETIWKEGYRLIKVD